MWNIVVDYDKILHTSNARDQRVLCLQNRKKIFQIYLIIIM